MQALWLIPLLPFLGAFLNGVVLKDRASKPLVTGIAVGSVGLTTVLALFYVIPSYLRSAEYAAGHGFEQVLWVWLPAGALKLTSGVFAELTIDFAFSAHCEELRAELLDFMDTSVYPAEG